MESWTFSSRQVWYKSEIKVLFKTLGAQDSVDFDDLDYDMEHNSVWYAETNIDEQGWTAEIYLPFSAFRFDSEINESTRC